MNTVSTTTDFDLTGSSISFNIGKSNYKRRHSHDYLEIFMMLDGTLAHYHEGKKYILTKNAFAIVRPGEEHFFRKHKSSSHLRFHISVTLSELKKITDALFPFFYEYLTTQGPPIFHTADERTAEDICGTAHKLISIMDNNESEYFQGLLRSLVCKALCFAYEQMPPKESAYPEWLNRFIDQLKTPDCVCLKVNEVAGLSNYSYSHLCKLFHKYTGTTLLEYFKDVKLSYARQLLEITDYPCRTVCEMIGYQSAGHFVKAFSQRFGVTPSEWRAGIRP